MEGRALPEFRNWSRGRTLEAAGIQRTEVIGERLDTAVLVAYEHHVWFDYDAPGRHRWDQPRILRQIEEASGTELDPAFVAPFLRMMERWGEAGVELESATDPVPLQTRLLGLLAAVILMGCSDSPAVPLDPEPVPFLITGSSMGLSHQNVVVARGDLAVAEEGERAERDLTVGDPRRRGHDRDASVMWSGLAGRSVILGS